MASLVKTNLVNKCIVAMKDKFQTIHGMAFKWQHQTYQQSNVNISMDDVDEVILSCTYLMYKHSVPMIVADNLDKFATGVYQYWDKQISQS